MKRERDVYKRQSQDRALVNLAAKRYRGFKQGKL